MLHARARGFHYTTHKDVVDVGGVRVSTDNQTEVPRWVGGGLALAGVVLTGPAQRFAPIVNDPMERTNISSGVKFESIVGYSRAVRVGPFVYVGTGTTATGANSEIVGVGDMYAQARQTIANIVTALGKAGARVEDVVRTRMYVTCRHPRDGKQVARAHREVFGAILPATTMVEVSKLIDPRMLVEIEADAVVS